MDTGLGFEAFAHRAMAPIAAPPMAIPTSGDNEIPNEPPMRRTKVGVRSRDILAPKSICCQIESDPHPFVIAFVSPFPTTDTHSDTCDIASYSPSQKDCNPDFAATAA